MEDQIVCPLTILIFHPAVQRIGDTTAKGIIGNRSPVVSSHIISISVKLQILYIIPIAIVRTVLQFDRDASWAHVVLVRVIVPLLGNSKRSTAINIRKRAKIQSIVCSCICSPSINIMPFRRTIKVLQLTFCLPDSCTGVFRDAINIGNTLGGITAELQFLSVLIQNGKVTAALLVIPLYCKVRSLCVVYIINIAACKIDIAINVEGKLTVLNICNGLKDSIRQPGLRCTERNKVFFLIIILKESFIVNSLPVIALHRDCVALSFRILLCAGVYGISVDWCFYHIISKALSARRDVIKVIKGDRCLTMFFLECCSFDRNSLQFLACIIFFESLARFYPIERELNIRIFVRLFFCLCPTGRIKGLGNLNCTFRSDVLVGYLQIP